MLSGNRLLCPFVLTGFTQDHESRRFAFDKIGADHVRKHFTVLADLNLIRHYGIHVQELPLLCRALLERAAESDEVRQFRFTEDDMRVHRADLLAAAGQKRKPSRPPPANAGRTWRSDFAIAPKAEG
jgi:hypothetical protein